MTHRERMLAAISGEIPDRVPFTYSATAEADNKFKESLGVRENLEDFFGCDKFLSVRDLLGKGFELPGRGAKHKTPPNETRVDIWGCERKLVRAGGGDTWG